MLLELAIKNFALIDHLHIQFYRGLNVLTGETGAGKSIIIDAVNMVIGGRGDREFIRYGADKSTIQAVFSLENAENVRKVLSEQGIEQDEEDVLVVTREIFSSGRSVCRVNGMIVTQGALKSITESLIDIHGQHEHQSLLNSEFHIDMLDAYGGKPISDLLLEVSQKHHDISQLKREMAKYCSDVGEREKRIDLLKFQINEIEEAKLKVDEEKELIEQRNLYANGEKIMSSVSKAYEELYEGGIYPSIQDNLSRTVHLLQNIAPLDPALSTFYENLVDVQYKIQDITLDIRKYRDELNFDPLLLEEIELRLDLINRLKRKYGGSVEEVLAYYDKIKAEFAFYENSEEEINRLEKEISEKTKALESQTVALSELRQEIALQFEKELIHILQTLNMGKIKFQVSIERELDRNNQYKISAKGIDQIEFLLSPNLGEPLRPLSKIASGGEMSRIMLAFKTLLADVDSIQCLIFDEVDTGISGKTAQIVGERLHQISNNRQVICITHLPQIAAQCDHHYLIEKTEENNATVTKVEKLSKERQIMELGRLLGGELTEITLKHAEEMIQQAYDKRKH